MNYTQDTTNKVPSLVLSLLGKSLLFFLILVVLTFTACGGGGGGSGSSGNGTLSLSLQDASSDDYQAVYVTIKEVQVHLGGDENVDSNWKVVANPNTTYNLLDLANGVREKLGLAELEPGDYTQMRLIIENQNPDSSLNIFSEPHPFPNYVIMLDDTIHQLKVPSGYQTGVKIVQGFEINSNQTTELILDFDASKSVVKAGNSNKWLLKPTIKVLEVSDYSIIRGTVTEEGTDNPIVGASVSAQVFDGAAADEANQVVVHAATITDENGAYSLFIEPGTYNIVVSAAGYQPKCLSVTTSAGDALSGIDFVLTPSEANGTVEGSISIPGSNTDQYATLSFRQVLSNGTEDVTVEVKSVNVADSTEFSESLPPDDYRAVVSSYQMVTAGVDATVDSNAVTNLGEIVLTEAP